MALGMFSLSTLITSYSLLVPTLYGIVFLNEAIGWTGYVGIVLLVVSIYLLNKKDETITFSIGWLVCIDCNIYGYGRGNRQRTLERN